MIIAINALKISCCRTALCAQAINDGKCCCVTIGTKFSAEIRTRRQRNCSINAVGTCVSCRYASLTVFKGKAGVINIWRDTTVSGYDADAASSKLRVDIDVTVSMERQFILAPSYWVVNENITISSRRSINTLIARGTRSCLNRDAIDREDIAKL